MDEFSMLYEGTDRGITEFGLAETPFAFLDAMQHIVVMQEHCIHDSIVGQLMWLD